MKIRLNIICTAVVATIPAGAIEPPPDTATPPAALLREEAAPAPVADKSPFMGVATAAVPDMVADHLGLSDSSGVIIRTIVPDSPAAKVGLSVNDIIVSIDGKAVADPVSFSSLIGGHKMGDRLKIDLIHKGKPAKVELTLSRRPADATAQLGTEPFLEGIPKIHADRLRGLIEQSQDAFGNGIPNLSGPDAQFEETFRRMRERMGRMRDGIQIPQSGGIGLQQNSTIWLMDGDGSVEINSSEEGTEVKVRGKDNAIIWSGPWNTEDDKAAAPADVRERIDKVNSGNGTGFSFRLGSPRGRPDTIDN